MCIRDRAQTAQTYVDMQALDPTEVRRRRAADEEFDVEDIITEDDDRLEALMDEPDTVGDIEAAMRNVEEQKQPGGSEQSDQDQPTPPVQTDGADEPAGVGVLVVKDGKILCGTRTAEAVSYTHLDVYKRQELHRKDQRKQGCFVFGIQSV